MRIGRITPDRSSGLTPPCTRALKNFVTPSGRFRRKKPESFAQDLSSAIDRFEAALGQRDYHQDRRAGATKGLEDAAQEARTVLAVLDARMPSWTKGDETLLAAWQGARQIRDRPGPKSSRKGAPPPPAKDSPPDADSPPPTA